MRQILDSDESRFLSAKIDKPSDLEVACQSEIEADPSDYIRAGYSTLAEASRAYARDVAEGLRDAPEGFKADSPKQDDLPKPHDTPELSAWIGDPGQFALGVESYVALEGAKTPGMLMQAGYGSLKEYVDVQLNDIAEGRREAPKPDQAAVDRAVKNAMLSIQQGKVDLPEAVKPKSEASLSDNGGGDFMSRIAHVVLTGEAYPE